MNMENILILNSRLYNTGEAFELHSYFKKSGGRLPHYEVINMLMKNRLVSAYGKYECINDLLSIKFSLNSLLTLT